MKKVILLIFVLLLTFSFCGCETKEERKARQAQETADLLNDRYEDARQDYNDLKNQLDRLNDY